MTEQEIADRLKQTIQPAPEPSVPAPVKPDEPINLATTAVEIDLDELTQYKLHDYFGEQYRPNDDAARQQLQYIFSEVSKMIPEQEYGFVVAKIRDLERIIGTSHAEDRRYKLYQWIKLNNMRRNIDAEMGAISNG